MTSDFFSIEQMAAEQRHDFLRQARRDNLAYRVPRAPAKRGTAAVATGVLVVVLVLLALALA